MGSPASSNSGTKANPRVGCGTGVMHVAGMGGVGPGKLRSRNSDYEVELGNENGLPAHSFLLHSPTFPPHLLKLILRMLFNFKNEGTNTKCFAVR